MALTRQPGAWRSPGRDRPWLKRAARAQSARRLAIAITLPFAAAVIAQLTPAIVGPYPYWGSDYSLYVAVSERWLNGGSFYQDWQLGGPYAIWGRYGAVLYPPVSLWLFVPFTILPAFLWWATPLGLTIVALARLRPRPIAWPLMMACLAWPQSLVMLVHGNPVMWSLAFVSLGVLHAWPSVLAVLKPSLFPFALIGAWRRSWWVAAGAVLVLALPFGSMWLDWARVLRNATDASLIPHLGQVPLLLIPVLAALFSPRQGLPIRGPIGLRGSPA